jgi:hypothetical protein
MALFDLLFHNNLSIFRRRASISEYRRQGRNKLPIVGRSVGEVRRLRADVSIHSSSNLLERY